MAWSSIRPFFNTHLQARSHSEWPDGFSVDNIPANILDKSYHISLGPISGDRQNQHDQESTVTVEIRTFYKGYLYPAEGIDTAISETEEIMKLCVKPENRVLTTGILNVVFNNADIDPIGETNDNAIVVTQTYSVRVIVAV